MSDRSYDFCFATKRAAIECQGGVCAWCGVRLNTPWTRGAYLGYAHHLRPGSHLGSDRLDNCVYLCWGDHLHIGHGMAPYDIDPQGGSAQTWVMMPRSEFSYWRKK